MDRLFKVDIVLLFKIVFINIHKIIKIHLQNNNL